MKTAMTLLCLALAVVGVCVLAGRVAGHRPVVQTPGKAQAETAATPQPGNEQPAPPLASAPPPSPAQPKANALESSVTPPLQAGVSNPIPARPAASSKSATPPTPAGTAKNQDALARAALSLVGLDAQAEAYWVTAINDDRLSADERQNLIEDLNEDGLADPKHPAPEDLPLIINRLALIEELAPNAMDKVNLDAFAEAYKDLVNLAQLAMGGGQPVR